VDESQTEDHAPLTTLRIGTRPYLPIFLLLDSTAAPPEQLPTLAFSCPLFEKGPADRHHDIVDIVRASFVDESSPNLGRQNQWVAEANRAPLFQRGASLSRTGMSGVWPPPQARGKDGRPRSNRNRREEAP